MNIEVLIPNTLHLRGYTHYISSSCISDSSQILDSIFFLSCGLRTGPLGRVSCSYSRKYPCLRCNSIYKPCWTVIDFPLSSGNQSFHSCGYLLLLFNSGHTCITWGSWTLLFGYYRVTRFVTCRWNLQKQLHLGIPLAFDYYFFYSFSLAHVLYLPYFLATIFSFLKSLLLFLFANRCV